MPRRVDTSAQPLAAALLLAVLWAVALFIVQELTTGSNYPLPLLKAVGARGIRLLLDCLACGVLVVALTGWRRYAAIAASGFVWLVLLVYHSYFGRTLSFSSMRAQYREGAAVLDFGVALVPGPTLASVLVAVAALVAIARWSHAHPLRGRRRIRWLAGLSAGYLLVALVSTQLIDRVEKLKRFATVDRIVMTNGYLLTWLGEWYHLDEAVLKQRAMDAAQVKRDRLTGLEPPVALGERVAIVQVESLEWAIVDHMVGDDPVMPFLRELAARSQRYRIEGIHLSGSCDADFTMLMDLHPVGDVNPFAVPGFDFTESLAARAARRGYRTVFFHGNDASFFDRGPAVRQMGFDSVLFREELEARYGLAARHWGVEDGDVLRLSARLLGDDDRPTLHFIITLTSHGPYHFLGPADYEVFAEPSGEAEHYLNSMRYVDRQLEAYVAALPAGTTVVVYGDHRSYVDYGQSEEVRYRDYVPFLVHRVGEDLAASQRTRGLAIAESGELTLLDAAGYVWSWFGDGAPSPEPG